MKKTATTISFLFLLLGLTAQSTEYKVDKYYISHTTDTLDIVEPIDSIQFDTTFSYTLNIIEVSENEKDTTITRKGQLTKAALQSELYSLTRQAFSRSARLQWSAFQALRNRNVYLAALNEAGINDYYASERTRVRQQLNGVWVIRSGSTVYRTEVSDNNGRLITVSSDTSGEPEGTWIATIVPRSRLFLSIAFRPGFGTDDEVFSTDGRNYFSSDGQITMRYR